MSNDVVKAAGEAEDVDAERSVSDQLRAARVDAVVERVARGQSYRSVARELEISAKTVQRAMADKETGRRVAERRREMTSETSGRLSQACAAAVTTLVEGLEEERAADRLKAAQLILGQTTRFRTMEELEARVVELEARLDALDQVP